MIKIDFSLAVALFIILSVFTISLIWVFFGKGKKNEKGLTLDPKYLWFCSICTYTYIYTKQDSFSICPRCGSYNSKAEAKTKIEKKDTKS